MFNNFIKDGTIVTNEKLINLRGGESMKVQISEQIKYIGVDDTTIDLFESQYVVPEGVSYNSYVILDEKVAVMDTVDKRGMEEWEKILLEELA